MSANQIKSKYNEAYIDRCATNNRMDVCAISSTWSGSKYFLFVFCVLTLLFVCFLFVFPFGWPVSGARTTQNLTLLLFDVRAWSWRWHLSIRYVMRPKCRWNELVHKNCLHTQIISNAQKWSRWSYLWRNANMNLSIIHIREAFI